jgi:ribonuclease BN (tRNA processing enzyme)
MEVMLLGTGGWAPTDSRETACVYLREGERVLLLDAGTGARRLITSAELIRGIARIDICLSHFHLDHIIGLSYLPGLPPETERVVWGPGSALYATRTTDLLRRMIAPPLFALDISQIASSVEELPVGELDIGPFRIATRAQEHHTQPSAAFRVGADLAYCTDTGYDQLNAQFAAGCRDLIHEAFYLGQAPDDTHSTPGEAARIARDAGVSRLTLVHLDPRFDQDAQLLEEAVAVFPQAQVGRDLTVLS